MKILVTIPHFYRPREGGAYASTRANPQQRSAALTQSLLGLRRLDSRYQYRLDIATHTASLMPAADSYEIDVLICTTQDAHLLDHLKHLAGWYRHQATPAEPMYLGFECHAAIRDHLADYDWFGFMEDDLVIEDPWFFRKLLWFNQQVGDQCLLLPNRMEYTLGDAVVKTSIDGDLRPDVTARFQDISDRARLDAEVMGGKVHFARPRNPHAGCFFLSQSQARHWIAQPWFLDRDASFVGPLESAASLSTMKSFRVYKAVAPTESFLEIRHPGGAFAGLIGKKLPVV